MTTDNECCVVSSSSLHGQHVSFEVRHTSWHMQVHGRVLLESRIYLNFVLFPGCGIRPISINSFDFRSCLYHASA